MTPAVIWFTGLSGSGKSTLAEWVAGELGRRGHPVEQLDGDSMRAVFPATGFEKAERDAHVRRVGFLASRLEAHGVIVVASFISPYRESRDFVRGLCRRFIEVHVSTPLAECERRDAKGLYAKARRGDIDRFTGVSDPYEPPLDPELTIDTTTTSVADAGRQVLDALEAPHEAKATR
jgi:adenylylsulfate kinase